MRKSSKSSKCKYIAGDCPNATPSLRKNKYPELNPFVAWTWPCPFEPANTLTGSTVPHADEPHPRSNALKNIVDACVRSPSPSSSTPSKPSPSMTNLSFARNAAQSVVHLDFPFATPSPRKLTATNAVPFASRVGNSKTFRIDPGATSIIKPFAFSSTSPPLGMMCASNLPRGAEKLTCRATPSAFETSTLSTLSPFAAGDFDANAVAFTLNADAARRASSRASAMGSKLAATSRAFESRTRASTKRHAGSGSFATRAASKAIGSTWTDMCIDSNARGARRGMPTRH